jgi:NaMN:DMB phosphoribosyltransferase
MKPGLPLSSALMAVLPILVAMAGAAHAETAAPASLPKITWTAPAAINIADPRLSLASPYAQRDTAPATPGMPKTAIDHRFASGDLAAVGYLCGLQPGPNERGGPASAYDAEGTFLGGQLKLAFK